jgi:hypothetical protein
LKGKDEALDVRAITMMMHFISSLWYLLCNSIIISPQPEIPQARAGENIQGRGQICPRTLHVPFTDRDSVILQPKAERQNLSFWSDRHKYRKITFKKYSCGGKWATRIAKSGSEYYSSYKYRFPLP